MCSSSGARARRGARGATALAIAAALVAPVVPHAAAAQPASDPPPATPAEPPDGPPQLPAAPPDGPPPLPEPPPPPSELQPQPTRDAWLDSNDTTLRAAGWEFDEARIVAGDIGAGTASLLVGPVVPAIGHWLRRERSTAWRLATMQAAGVSVAVLGAVVGQAGGGREAPREIGGAVAAAGGGAAAAAWLGDVIGAFKGDTARLPDNTARADGASLDAYLTTLVVADRDIESIVVARAALGAPRWTLRPSAEVRLDGRYRRFGVSAGYRAPLRSASSLTVGGTGFDEVDDAGGYGRTVLGGEAVLTVDMGDLIRTVRSEGRAGLAGIVWTTRALALADYAFFDAAGATRLVGAQRTFHVPVETNVGLNPADGVYIEAGYLHRRDELVGAIGPRAGVVTGRLGVVPPGPVRVDLRVEHGAGTRLWFGVQWQFASPAALGWPDAASPAE